MFRDSLGALLQLGKLLLLSENIQYSYVGTEVLTIHPLVH